MLGIGTGSRPPSLLLSQDGVTNPMLGRYVVDKEIGKGAMGTVYLGRDPKINRVVAIKTIALSEEFDDDELQTAKDRFFREAESAGRLNHPDIVTDAVPADGPLIVVDGTYMTIRGTGAAFGAVGTTSAHEIELYLDCEA